MPRIIPIKLPRGWSKNPHKDELHGVARRINMQFVRDKRALQRDTPLASSPGSTGLTGITRINELRKRREISAMRVAAKVGFSMAGIRDGARRQAIRRYLLANAGLTYTFTKAERKSAYRKMFNGLNRIEGLGRFALHQFLKGYMSALVKLRNRVRRD